VTLAFSGTSSTDCAALVGATQAGHVLLIDA
jgi:hypothetical protein